MICGVDEAGRGPVIGPLVVAGINLIDDHKLVEYNVKDSKKITPKRRNILAKIIKQIAQKRNIKESTVWGHLSKLIKYNQTSVWKGLPKEKVYKILSKINNKIDSLKNIKKRINDPLTTFDEISCVLASVK